MVTVIEELRSAALPPVNEEQEELNLIQDYDVYHMTKQEYIKYLGMGGIGLFCLGYVFYRNIVLSLILTVFSVFILKSVRESLMKKRKEELKFQFRDALISLASSLGSGSVIEKAFEDSIRDLRILYPYAKVHIIDEFTAVIVKKKNGEEIESSLVNFAKRANVDCISDFVDVFVSSNKAGGNSMDIVRNSISMISEKMEIEKDIAVMVSGKKFEQRILTVAPVGFIILLSVISGDYMEPMFTTAGGHIVMTIVMGVIAVSYFISSKIMNIEL